MPTLLRTPAARHNICTTDIDTVLHHFPVLTRRFEGAGTPNPANICDIGGPVPAGV